MCMKKAGLVLALVIALSGMPSFAADEPTVIATYKSEFSPTQGVGGWYFCEFSGTKSTQLEWNGRYWGTSPYLIDYEVNTGDQGQSVGYEFVAPSKGVVRVKGEVGQSNPECANGDGVDARIVKDGTQMWKKELIKYGIGKGEYDLTFSVKKGSKIQFIVDPRTNNFFDWTNWFPTVEYVVSAYAENDSDYTYYQKIGEEKKELAYNEEQDRYFADDKKSFISSEEIMPSADYSLIKQFKVKEDGRYRVFAELNSDDMRGGGTVTKVYHNGKHAWSQMFTEDETGVLDFRLFAKKDDIIELEIKAKDYTGYNLYEWTSTISRYVGTLTSLASTSMGHSNVVKEQYTLGSLVTPIQGENGTSYYSERYDVKYPMKYNAQNRRWEQNIPLKKPDNGYLNYAKVDGYISPAAICAGNYNESILDTTIAKDGMLRIDGEFGIATLSDGVVVRVLLNNKLLWSSRVGGERAVRWDEPFDISYFSYNTNVVANVKAGDNLKFVFNQWRKAFDDDVDISGIKLSYIDGNPLSVTTKWKLNRSMVIDTNDKCVYINGIKEAADVYVENGTTYISASDINKLLGTAYDSGYVQLREAAESKGKSVVWAADRLVLMFDEIETFYGYSELSEIKTALEGGVLFD